MDKVFIEGLEVDTLIGAYDWERGIRQCLQLDLTFAWDIRPAAAGDDLSKALDYAAVHVHVQQFAAAAQFELVETFAERLAESLLAQFGALVLLGVAQFFHLVAVAAPKLALGGVLGVLHLALKRRCVGRLCAIQRSAKA